MGERHRRRHGHEHPARTLCREIVTRPFCLSKSPDTTAQGNKKWKMLVLAGFPDRGCTIAGREGIEARQNGSSIRYHARQSRHRMRPQYLGKHHHHGIPYQVNKAVGGEGKVGREGKGEGWQGAEGKG